MLSGPSLWAGDDHDLHLSLCELRFNEKSSSYEVAIKIFIDDLELAIGKKGVKGLKIGTPNENASANDHITSYLDTHFSIKIDGVRLKVDFIGKEITDDKLAVWCYVEYSQNTSHPRKCILSNRILLDVYNDQRNIMDIKLSKTHKDYTILEAENTSWSYSY